MTDNLKFCDLKDFVISQNETFLIKNKNPF
jgi:hypothetical protein